VGGPDTRAEGIVEPNPAGRAHPQVSREGERDAERLRDAALMLFAA